MNQVWSAMKRFLHDNWQKLFYWNLCWSQIICSLYLFCIVIGMITWTCSCCIIMYMSCFDTWTTAANFNHASLHCATLALQNAVFPFSTTALPPAWKNLHESAKWAAVLTSCCHWQSHRIHSLISQGNKHHCLQISERKDET